MTARAATVTLIEEFLDDCHVITWTGLLNGDHGDPVKMPGSADRSVQVLGTLGAGGSVQIQGSNVPAPTTTFASTDFVPLTDPSSTQLDINSLKMEGVLEIPLWIRPKVTAGDGTTNLTVRMLFRRSNK